MDAPAKIAASGEAIHFKPNVGLDARYGRISHQITQGKRGVVENANQTTKSCELAKSWRKLLTCSRSSYRKTFASLRAFCSSTTCVRSQGSDTRDTQRITERFRSYLLLPDLQLRTESMNLISSFLHTEKLWILGLSRHRKGRPPPQHGTASEIPRVRTRIPRCACDNMTKAPVWEALSPQCRRGRQRSRQRRAGRLP